MIRPFGKPVRPVLEDLIRRTTATLFVASPFISGEQARWLLGMLARHSDKATVRTLTSASQQSVASGALEIEALQALLRARLGNEVMNVPRLHAKVYVADSNAALVTSANLTYGGLEANCEYGVAIASRAIVRRIREDMEAYARLGNQLTNADLERLVEPGRELRAAWQRLAKTREGPSGRRFQTVLADMRRPVLEAQVGGRSANSIFAEAIRFVLRDGPLTTRQVNPRVQDLLPDLCDDREELIINGQRFGKKWKHVLRNAQVFLRRAGEIEKRGGAWAMLRPRSGPRGSRSQEKPNGGGCP